MQNLNLTTARTIAASDWGPAIERTARALAAVIVAVYVAGYTIGATLHRANDGLARLWRQLVSPTPSELQIGAKLGVRPRPRVIASQPRPAVAERPASRHQATARKAAPATRATTPEAMARAAQLVRNGSSVRAAARQAGVSRTTLRRHLVVRAREPRPSGRGGMARRAVLLLDVAPERFNRRAAGTAGEVTGAPKVLAMRPQRELLPQHPTADALQGVHQCRHR